MFVYLVYCCFVFALQFCFFMCTLVYVVKLCKTRVEDIFYTMYHYSSDRVIWAWTYELASLNVWKSCTHLFINSTEKFVTLQLLSWIHTHTANKMINLQEIHWDHTFIYTIKNTQLLQLITCHNKPILIPCLYFCVHMTQRLELFIIHVYSYK